MLDAFLGKRPGSEPLFAALRQCRVHFIGAAAFSALVNLLYLTPTLYMMQVYDRVVPTAGLTTLVLVSAVAVLALGSLAALDWLRTRILIRAGIQLDRDLAGTILARVTEAGGRTSTTSGSVWRRRLNSPACASAPRRSSTAG